MKKLVEFRSPTGLTPQAINEISEANQKIVEKHRLLSTVEDLIDIKKEHSRRENALRPLLLNIGMVVSILFAILAINWKTYSTNNLVDLGQVENDLNEIIEIPISKQPPPPPPKQEVFKIAEVKNEEIIEDLTINLDVEVTEDEAMEVVDFTPPIVEEEEIDEVFVIVEQEPSPKGGIKEFYAYLANELKYPPMALRIGVSGSVYVQFVIEKDGSITNVKLAKGIGAGCDEEAVRVIQNAPAWNPGKQRGVPVRVRKIIPVRFILAEQ